MRRYFDFVHVPTYIYRSCEKVVRISHPQHLARVAAGAVVAICVRVCVRGRVSSCNATLSSFAGALACMRLAPVSSQCLSAPLAVAHVGKMSRFGFPDGGGILGLMNRPLHSQAPRRCAFSFNEGHRSLYGRARGLRGLKFSGQDKVEPLLSRLFDVRPRLLLTASTTVPPSSIPPHASVALLPRHSLPRHRHRPT